MQHSEKSKINEKRLDLQQNCEGIYVCKGRIEVTYPIYLPKESLLSENIIFAAQEYFARGSVNDYDKCSIYLLDTFLKVTYKIYHPQLLRLYATLCSISSTTKTRTITKRQVRSSMQFQVIGTKEYKACILFFSCSLSRAVHLN